MKDIVNFADLAYLDLHPLATFSDFEVHPCKEEAGHVHQIDDTDKETPDFWSVYIRYNPSPDNNNIRGLDCIADCKTQEAAEEFRSLLETLVSRYSPT